jgi:hypothetical protein
VAWRKTPSAARRAVTAGGARAPSRRERRRQERNAVTAAATIVRSDRSAIIQKKRWQDEAWDQWRANGELWYATEWKANALSRVRLKAAKIVPGADEPEIVDTGPAAELMEQFAGGIGGQSPLLKSFSIKLDIAGDSYYVLYEDDEGVRHSGVYSADVIRKETNGSFSIQVDETGWVALPQESLVVRIWNQDEQFPWLAISPTEPALGTLREIDLYNRRIITELTSRLASNGLLFIPDEVTFPVRDEFSDAADPFISELIDVMQKAIQNPGSAAAALPIPVRVTADMIDKFQHMEFSGNVVEETLSGRDRALGRLAKMLNVPAEVLTGMGDVNHWGAWQIEDAAVEIHVVPTVETICRGLTIGYLLPGLSGDSLTEYDENGDPIEELAEGEQYVVWYDTSELKKKPDLGERAVQLHDRVAISDAALRRATGFDDGDAPTDEERDRQILTKLAYSGQQAVNSYELLTGTPVAEPEGEAAPAAEPSVNLPAPGSAPGPNAPGLPATRGELPPGPGESTIDSRFLEITERAHR